MNNAYQNHIDTLRALAVLLVIVNHLDFNLFSGGFIGVDVFFVISGYLITKNIIQEKSTTSGFKFKNFYRRRIIRLAPAFLAVIFISSIFFLSIMTKTEIENYLKTIIASLTLTSNIYYTTLLNDYFSITAKTTPLLHIWSLNLEEQFYLFWPFLMILIYKLKNNIRLILIILIALCSLYISHQIYQKNIIAAYYWLPSRIFEFAIGASLVFLKIKKIRKFKSILIGTIALLGIIITSTLITKDTLFPSYTALLPCLFSALFIYTAHSYSTNRLRWLQYIGKISYPMYLWHWPIIVYLSLFSVEFTLSIKFLVIFFTFTFSLITYELIERKAKHSDYLTNNAFQTLFLMPFLFIILACITYLQFIKKTNEKTINNQNLIKCIDTTHINQECYFGELNAKNLKILLVGDSHANAQYGLVNYFAESANLKGYEVTYSSTLFLPNTSKYYTDSNKIENKVQIFTDANELQYELIKRNNFNFVVMGGFFPNNWIRNHYVSQKENDIDHLKSKAAFTKGLGQAIEIIIASGAQPVLINDNPLLNNLDVNCNLRQKLPEEVCYTLQTHHDEAFKQWTEIINVLKVEYPALYVIDFNDIICKNNKCYSFINDQPLYRDSQHLTYLGAREIAIEYLKHYENPFYDK